MEITDGISKRLRWIVEIIMVLLSFIVLIPLWMVMVNSLQERKYANLFGFFPKGSLHFENYLTVIREGELLRAFLNGLFMASISVFCIVMLTTMAAFIIGRRSSKLTEFIYYFFVAGLVVPGALVPTYWILKTLHLLNTYPGVILIYISICMPFSVFLYTGFIKTIPKELDEAAIVDGSGQLRLLYGIIFPLLKPVTMTVIIFNFVGIWNEVNNQLFFLNSKKWSMPMMVYKFFGQYEQDWNLVFADILLTIIPILLVYLFGQKYIISGMTAGAVKG